MKVTVPSELIERKSVEIYVAKLSSLKTRTALVVSHWKGEKRGIYVDMIGLETLSNLGGGLYFKDRKIRGYRAAGHVPF